MHTAIGVSSPITWPFQTNPTSLAPYAIPSLGAYPSAAYPYGSQQSTAQWLQALPQQIQQLQQLAYVQQQQLQQVLQIVPAQLQQLQQQIQLVPHQVQQLLQLVAQQQFGGGAQGVLGAGIGHGTQGLGMPFQTVAPFPPTYAAASGHVM